MQKTALTLFSIEQTARILDVSSKTLRRLEKKGTISPSRGKRGKILFTFEDVVSLRDLLQKPALSSKTFSVKEAANILKVSPDTIRRWEREGKIQTKRTPGGHRRFTHEEIASLKRQEFQPSFSRIQIPPQIPLSVIGSPLIIPRETLSLNLKLISFVLVSSFLIVLANGAEFAQKQIQDFKSELAFLKAAVILEKPQEYLIPAVLPAESQGGLLASLIPSDINLLANSSFEAGVLGYEPKGWSYILTSSLVNTKVANDSIRSGTLALKFEDGSASKANPLAMGLSQPTTMVINGRKYIFSVNIRTQNLVGNPTLRIGFIGTASTSDPNYGSAGFAEYAEDKFKDFTLTPDSTSDWTTFSFEYNNAALGKYPFVQISNYQGGKIFLDDLTLYEILLQPVIASPDSGNLASTKIVDSQILYQSITKIGDGSLTVSPNGTIYPTPGLGLGATLGTSTNRFGSIYTSQLDTSSSLTANSLTLQGLLTPASYSSNPTATGSGSIIFRSDVAKLYFYSGTAWTEIGSGSATSAFTDITSGTNITAAMVVGSGASLAYSGTGTITASDLTCTNCLDFTEFEDTLDLDAALTLNQSANSWTQSFTGTTTIGLTYNADSLTSGKGLYLSSTSIGLTGNLAEIVLSGSNAANTGNVLRVAQTGALSANVPLMVTNLGTGLSFRVNDATGDTDTTPFAIDASGNVGIGTASPGSYKLYVNGTAYVTSVMYAGAVGTSTIAPPGSNLDISSGQTDISTTGDQYHLLVEGIFAPTSGTATYSGVNVSPTINQTGGANGVTRGLYVNPTLTSAFNFRAIETVRGDVILGSTSGNVGIGTNTPGGKLSVAETGTNNKGIRLIGSGSRETYLVPNLSAGGYNPLSQVNDFGLFFSEGSVGTGNLVIGPWSSTAAGIRITNTGNVGVGTTTPKSAFHVKGPSGVTSFTGSTVLGLTVDGSTSTNDYSGIDFRNSLHDLPKARIAAYFNGTVGSYLQFGTSNNYTTGVTNTAMTIDYAGNVGIGTTAPADKLEVAGSIRITDTSQSASAWALSRDGVNERIHSMAVYNGYLYAGQGNSAGNGDIFYFDGSSWNTAYDGGQEAIMSLVVFNGRLYAGQGTGGGDADIYVCNPATAGNANICDNASDWTLSYDGIAAFELVISMAVYNDRLYAGLGQSAAGDGDIIVCTPTAAGDPVTCDNGTADWAISLDNTVTYEEVDALVVYNGMLYAGLGNSAGDGDIRRCIPHLAGDVTACDNAADWTAAHSPTATAYDRVRSFAVYNGKLYAGMGYLTAGFGDVLVCSPSNAGETSQCDDTSDWAVVLNLGEEEAPALAVYNGKLYIGYGRSADGDGDIWVFNGSEAATSYAGAADIIDSLAVYNGKLYMGQGLTAGEGDIYTYTEARAATYPVKFAVGTGTSQKIGNLWFENKDEWGVSGGAAADVGVFKLSHALITTAGLYDVVEDYPTHDSSLSKGEIVAIDPYTPGYVARADAQSRAKLVGVISSNPGIRLSQESSSGHVPVALLGRVPVSVDPAGPAFAAGDPLTVSEKAGLATKATTTGQIIGKSLESWSPGGKSMVMIFINLSWYDQPIYLTSGGDITLTDNNVLSAETNESTPSAEILDSSGESPPPGSEIASMSARISALEGEMALLKSSALTGTSSSEVSTSLLADLTVLGKSVLGDTVINGKLDVGILSFDSLLGSINAIGTLKVQPLALAGIEFLDNAIEMDKNGNLNINKGVIAGNDKIRGSELITTGVTTIKVEKVWDSTPVSIVVTPTYGAYAWISEISNSGFTINVSSSPGKDEYLNWFAIW